MVKSGKQGARKRVKVKDLPTSKKRATTKEMKKVKGGVFADGSVRFLKSTTSLPYLEQDTSTSKV